MTTFQYAALYKALHSLDRNPVPLSGLTPDVVRIVAFELRTNLCKTGVNGDRKSMPVGDSTFAEVVLRKALKMAALELRADARQMEVPA